MNNSINNRNPNTTARRKNLSFGIKMSVKSPAKSPMHYLRRARRLSDVGRPDEGVEKLKTGIDEAFKSGNVEIFFNASRNLIGFCLSEMPSKIFGALHYATRGFDVMLQDSMPNHVEASFKINNNLARKIETFLLCGINKPKKEAREFWDNLTKNVLHESLNKKTKIDTKLKKITKNHQKAAVAHPS